MMTRRILSFSDYQIEVRFLSLLFMWISQGGFTVSELLKDFHSTCISLQTEVVAFIKFRAKPDTEHTQKGR